MSPTRSHEQYVSTRRRNAPISQRGMSLPATRQGSVPREILSAEFHSRTGQVGGGERSVTQTRQFSCERVRRHPPEGGNAGLLLVGSCPCLRPSGPCIRCSPSARQEDGAGTASRSSPRPA